jgi:hypothetical protein
MMQSTMPLRLFRASAHQAYGIAAGLVFCLYTLLLCLAVVPMILVVAVRGLLGMHIPRSARPRPSQIIHVDGLVLRPRVQIPVDAGATR